MKVHLIGSGYMGMEYIKVLSAQHHDVEVIGREDETASKLEAETGKRVFRGGAQKFYSETKDDWSQVSAIVAVTDSEAVVVACAALKAGVKRILVEKPAGLSLSSMQSLFELATQKSAKVFVAYNRRFFASTQELVSRVEGDGGAQALHFEFTEWSHKLENAPFPEVLKKRWVLGNSSHVLDLAFFLCGKPEKMHSEVSGNLSWHPSASVFVGSGKTQRGILFSYLAHWESAGRWAVQVLTKKNRYYLSPLETLQVQERGKLTLNPVTIDDDLDKRFKPGIYKQTESFLTRTNEELLQTLQGQLAAMKWYETINGGPF